MKTVSDLQNDISTLFGKMISQLQPNELNVIISFILTSFANDFPEMKAVAYKYAYNFVNNGQGTRKVYLEEIAPSFLELKMIMPIKPANPVYTLIRDDQIVVDGYLPLEEVYAIQMASDYISEMETFYTPSKPLVLNDATGEYTTISKDSILLMTCERVLNPGAVPEYVYAVLRPYAYQKFIDFIINRNFGNMLEMNSSIFQLMYGAISQDLTSGEGLEGIQSISLSGLSIDYNNKLLAYANALNVLQQGISNPAFVKEMNDIRDRHMGAFKRKKRLFYNQNF